MAEINNILLTTMSTMKDLFVNYYYVQRDGKKLFCNGISALEPGSKYLLSKYKIDKIVVVGTKKTIGKNDKRGLESIREVDNTIDNASAYGIYKARVAEFVQDNIGDNTVKNLLVKGIVDREQELRDLYIEYKDDGKKINPFLDTEDSWKTIRKMISDSFEKGLANPQAHCLNEHPPLHHHPFR